MNSGIGDRNELNALGIEPKIHLPDVGKNLTDHPRLANNWFVKANGRTFDLINRNASLTTELLRKWSLSHTGPLDDTFVSHLAFSRLPEDSVLRQIRDPAAGPNTAHYELGISVRGLFPPKHVLTNLTSRMGLLALNPLSVIS